MHRCLFVHLCAEEISKLSIADLSVTISVNSANNREDLSIDQTSAELPKEILNVNLSDLSNSEFVKTSEGCLWCVVRLILQF